MTTYDFTQEPDKILLDLINNNNDTSLLIGDLTFGIPATLPNPQEEYAFNNRKTQIRVTATGGSGYKNFADLTYTRVHFRDVFLTESASSIEFPFTSVSFELLDNAYLSDLIPRVNSLFGVNLQTTDYWNQTMPVFAENPPYEATYVLLEARPTSEVFKGGVKIQIFPTGYIPSAYTSIRNFIAVVLLQPDYW